MTSRRGGDVEMPDPILDRYLRIVCRAADAPVGLLALPSGNRQLIVGRSGKSSGEAETYFLVQLCAEVLDSGEPLVRSDPPTGDPHVCFPVRCGDEFGVLGVFAAGARDWSESDVLAIADVVTTLEAELDLRRATERLADRLETARLEQVSVERVAKLSAELAKQVSGLEVVEAVLEHSRKTGLGDIVALALLDDGDEMLHFAHGESLPDDIVADWQTAPIDADVPMAAAIREGVPIWLRDRADMARFPLLGPTIEAVGLQSFASLPLFRGTRAIGVLGIGRVDGTGLDEEGLLEVATAVEHALARALKYDVESEHARILQDALLPQVLPTIAALDLCWAYSASAVDASVGGDWYDAIGFDDRAMLVIGDVCGHDIEAARIMARIRHGLGALLTTGTEPPDVLRSAHQYLLQGRDRAHATCCIVEVMYASGEARVWSAGHPPPILITTAGDARVVEVEPAPPIGAFESAAACTHLELAPGDTILLYTDGLIERRDRNLDDSLDRLLTQLNGFQGSAAGLSARLEPYLATEDDDVAVIVARYLGEGVR